MFFLSALRCWNHKLELYKQTIRSCSLDSLPKCDMLRIPSEICAGYLFVNLGIKPQIAKVLFYFYFLGLIIANVNTLPFGFCKFDMYSTYILLYKQNAQEHRWLVYLTKSEFFLAVIALILKMSSTKYDFLSKELQEELQTIARCKLIYL